MRKFLLILSGILCGSVLANEPLIDGLQGSGEQEDPVLISSADDLRLLSAFIMNGANYSTATAGKYFEMTNNISFQADSMLYDFDGDSVNESNFIPIGGRQAPGLSSDYRLFQGIFDGKKHIISGLRVLYENNTNYVGLFGVTWGATIKNVGIENGEFSGNGCVSALCGQANSSSRISECFVRNCNVTGTWMYVGGVCAANASSSTIENCYIDNSFISGSDFVGGFCGLNNTIGGVSFIKNCYSTADVETKNKSTYYGGFCGYSTNDTAIVNSYVIDGWQVTDSAEPGRFSLRGNVRNEAFMISSEFVDTLNDGLSVAAWQAHCGGEGTPSLLWECTVTSASEYTAVQNKSLQIYPNPAFDKITVNGAVEYITVYDINGRTVMNVTAKGDVFKTLDISSLPAGQYIIKDKVAAVKIIKK
ncbi:MAG: T9SS type A sorting domain-containing protein [Prevotellaceae bacterium]|jgi:hypothetical protein|nr:T9SS type A sorting domain-containing protein [Prevotellaceae bacterium]